MPAAAGSRPTSEEMHAIYMRGVLLKLENLRLRWQACARQLAGSLGGWSASPCFSLTARIRRVTIPRRNATLTFPTKVRFAKMTLKNTGFAIAFQKNALGT